MIIFHAVTKNFVNYFSNKEKSACIPEQLLYTSHPVVTAVLTGPKSAQCDNRVQQPVARLPKHTDFSVQHAHRPASCQSFLRVRGCPGTTVSGGAAAAVYTATNGQSDPPGRFQDTQRGAVQAVRIDSSGRLYDRDVTLLQPSGHIGRYPHRETGRQFIRLARKLQDRDVTLHTTT